MLGLKYYSYQYYLYQDRQKLNEILKYDSIGEIKLDEDEKIIEYKINRSNCILLSDLIELIKIGFIRFHLGQLLQLFINLLEKVKYIENHHIEHKYLSLDRIWLKLENNQYLTILYKKIEYEIAFTGYQNKFHENLQITECADSKNILQIISSIINCFIEKDIVCNKNQVSKNEIINKIYKAILTSCQMQVLQDTINIINQLLLDNQFDPNYQTVSFDDKKVDLYKYSKRKSQQKNIEDKLQQFIKKYDKNPLVLELFLFEKIQEMRINLKNWSSKNLDEKCEQQQYQELLQDYEKKNQQLQQDASSLITNLINDSLKINFLSFFKLEMEQSLKQQIIDKIMRLKILKYFDNSKETYKCYKTDFYFKLLIDSAIPVITNYVYDYIQLQIMIIINDLI